MTKKLETGLIVAALALGAPLAASAQDTMGQGGLPAPGQAGVAPGTETSGTAGTGSSGAQQAEEAQQQAEDAAQATEEAQQEAVDPVQDPREQSTFDTEQESNEYDIESDLQDAPDQSTPSQMPELDFGTQGR